MKKLKISQSVQILLGLVLGILFGLFCNLTMSAEFFNTLATNVLSPVGTIFLNGLKVTIVPLVMLSISTGIASIGDPKKLGRVGGKTIIYFLITTIIAVIIGLALGSIVKPGAGVDLVLEKAYEGKQGNTIIQMLVNMFPSNLFESMLKTDMLAILVFSIIFGLGIVILGDQTKQLVDILNQANLVMMKFIEFFMLLAPYAVFCLIAKVVGQIGIAAMLPLFKYLLCILIGCLIQLIVVYGGMLQIFANKSIIKFIQKFAPVMSFAFSSQSSTASIPLNIDTCEKRLGISRKISSFILPFGATVNMNGTAVLQGVAILFVAQYSGVTLTISQLVTVVLTAVLSCIGAAGMPGTALIMLTAVCQSVGLPLDAIALLMGVDRIADMIRTTINVTGDAVVSLIVSKGENEFDEEVFDSKTGTKITL